MILNYDTFVALTFMDWIPFIRFDFLGIVFLVFCSVLVIQLFYLFFFNFRLLVHKEKDLRPATVGVSIIICARNEEDNLFKNLPAILNQDYPNFEVIVVNDQSSDGSKHIITAYQKEFSNLKLIELERNRHRKFGKKVPLTIGVKGAKNPYLLLTDADCKPDSNKWLREMVKHFSEEKEIVIGYGPYERKKGFLNKMIRFDTTSVAMTYLSFAKNGMPYMGVGRNMGYKRDLFFAVDGFKKHYHIQSGDDDLFMQDAANHKNVAIELAPETFVYSTPKNTWKAWFRQKQRHYTTAPKYKLINKLFLGIFPASLLLMLISFFILLFNYKWWLFATALLLIRFIFYWLINGFVFRKLKSADLVLFYPFYELLHFFMMPFVYYSSDRTDKSKW